MVALIWTEKCSKPCISFTVRSTRCDMVDVSLLFSIRVPESTLLFVCIFILCKSSSFRWLVTNSIQLTFLYHMPMFLELERPKIRPAHCVFLVLLALNSCLIKANFPLARLDKSLNVSFSLLAAASLVSESSDDGVGESVKTNELSMRTIWLKLGLRLGCSTQHDWMMNARSGDILSGRLGRSCCIIRLQKVMNKSTWKGNNEVSWF